MGTNIMQNTREIVATLNNNNDVISRFKYDLPIDVANTEMLVKIDVKRSKWRFDMFVLLAALLLRSCLQRTGVNNIFIAILNLLKIIRPKNNVWRVALRVRNSKPLNPSV